MKKLIILATGGVRVRPTSKAALEMLSKIGLGEHSFEFLLTDDAGEVVEKIMR